MKNQNFKKYFFSGLILLFSSELFATAESDFKQGVESFNTGDHASAVNYFESAKKQGLNIVALDYNLASSYYKLGKYESAKKYFNKVSLQPDMKDLAEYNLGLIAIKQKNINLALTYFNSIASSGKDEKLIRLSKNKLVALKQPKSSLKKKQDNRLQAYFSTNFAYDDNIAAVSSDSVLDVSDTYYDLYAWFDVLLTGTRKQGWLTDFSFYNIDYSSTDDYDEDQITIGLKKTLKINDWNSSIHFNLSKTTYGGEDFQSASRLDLKGRKLISKNEIIYLRYQIEDINSDNTIYDYLEGWRQRARVEYRHYTSTNIKQIYYELELNNRGTLQTPTYAYEYSPTRHTLQAIYTQILNKNWRLSGDIQYRYSEYPSSPTMNREDDQLKLAISGDYRFDRTFKLTARAYFIDNASTADQYSYNKYVYKIGLSKFF